MSAPGPRDQPPSRLGRYLASLPDGLASYPQCQTKGSVFRSLLDGAAIDGAGLPDPLRERVADPPLASEWFSEVHLWALVLAVADRRAMETAGPGAVRAVRAAGRAGLPCVPCRACRACRT